MKSGKNYFVCNRSLFKNPLWYAEKFTKGQAWVDLFGNANHSPGWFEIRGQRVDIGRGQTGRSIESLARDWKWSRNKVKRFLNMLENDGMILRNSGKKTNHLSDRKTDHLTNQQTDHLTSIITICNYDKFQLNKKDSEPSDELPDEPPNELPDEPQTKRIQKRNNITHKPDGISDQIWNDFVAHRKTRKAPITKTALSRIKNEADKAGWSLENVFIEMISRGWTGFNSEWVTKQSNHNMSV